MEQVKILNASLDNIYSHQLLENLRHGGSVFTLNVDHLMKLQKDWEFYRAYTSATYRVCDSQILKYASTLLGQPIREKISGSDLLPSYIRHYQNDPSVTLFLLGAGSGVAEITRHRVNEMTGRMMVVDVYSPSYSFENNPGECQEIIERINRSRATTLAIGLGAPKQEIWIYKNRHRLTGIKVFLAIGAALDFEAGTQQRSPRWMSESGLEWLHRLMSEPKRLWKRYLWESLPLFWLLPLQMLQLYRPPERLGLAAKTAIASQNCDRLLYRAGLLSPQQLAIAQQLQADYPHLKCGEIIGIKGWLSKQTVDFFAHRLPQLASDMRQRPLGEYLRQAGLLNEGQIRHLLEEHKHYRIGFGELAIRKGWVSRTTVDFFLRYVAPECETLPYAAFSTPPLLSA
ncbi:WecB/TagA/CpsF family glycosyltransferase [Synechococcus sp. PCC 7336]|uniref:WecB/TagA/CpsF family glycosyltransferase n=1 Tax=Synechococcus sp. PCC 7336 TaxID=195250 RepID=UPI0003463260|nr:WecB/TagA/CpsF family glycosyltransferase [Synechococcus sp. PCC 7336]